MYEGKFFLRSPGMATLLHPREVAPFLASRDLIKMDDELHMLHKRRVGRGVPAGGHSYMQVPIQIVSPTMILLLQFSAAMTQRLWQYWEDVVRPTLEQSCLHRAAGVEERARLLVDAFFDFLVGHCEATFADAGSENPRAWDETMAAMGFSTAFRDRQWHVAPVRKDPCDAQDCRRWVVATLRGRIGEFMVVHDASWRRVTGAGGQVTATTTAVTATTTAAMATTTAVTGAAGTLTMTSPTSVTTVMAGVKRKATDSASAPVAKKIRATSIAEAAAFRAGATSISARPLAGGATGPRRPARLLAEQPGTEVKRIAAKPVARVMNNPFRSPVQAKRLIPKPAPPPLQQEGRTRIMSPEERERLHRQQETRKRVELARGE